LDRRYLGLKLRIGGARTSVACLDNLERPCCVRAVLHGVTVFLADDPTSEGDAVPRKKSVKLSARWFSSATDDVCTFLSKVAVGQSEEHVSWLHSYAIIRLYRAFESLMLETLVGAINNDSATVAATTGVAFPKHMTDEVCEFLITGTGYFDFKGRSGLISTLKSFVPEDHYVLTVTKKATYRNTLDQLCTLRNFAAHESAKSKAAVLKALGCKRISSSGAWLKRHGRFQQIATGLKALAAEIEAAAPY
jgi:hypothetical protein